MRDIKFGTVFPTAHEKKGQPTCFVEKVLATQSVDALLKWLETQPANVQGICGPSLIKNYTPKLHTIRAGQRWTIAY